MKQLVTAALIFLSIAATANTQRYRLMFNGDPSTEVTIGWEQVNSSGTTIYYDVVDHGTNTGAYAFTHGSDRSVSYMGMDNHFARLTGLQPNTAYYFVIADGNSTSQRFWFRTCPDNSSTGLSFVSGGDSRSGQTQRRNSNRMVAKIRPHAVLFGGDLVNTPGNTSVQDWMDDWQLATTSDGQMIPLVHSFGNHEEYGSGGPEFINYLFDAPYDVYYKVTFGGNLFSIYTLNGELLPNHTIPNNAKRTAQRNWLAAELPVDNAIWKAAQYHRPIVPHYSGKGEGFDEYSDWANLFYDNGVRLVLESDAHVMKITEEVKPVYTGNPSGNSSNWFTTTGLDPNKGITFLGEGTWGTIRTPDDNHPMTSGSASFYGFNWILVTECDIKIRTIDTQSPNSVVENAPGAYFNVDPTFDAVTWEPTGAGSGVRTIALCYPPEADFSGTPTSIFTGQSVSFTDLSSQNPTSWSWDFGDGNNSTQQNPSHTYTAPGVYTVSLTASNADGSGTETKVDYITVVNPTAPTADFSGTPTTVTVGGSVDFTDLSTGVPSGWNWTFTGGTPSTSTAQNPTGITYNATGLYQVSLTATNAYGNDTETKTAYIEVVSGATIAVPISTGNDDVEERNANGQLYFNSSDLEMCYDGSTSNENQHVGLRFQNVTIPNNATITNAYLEFSADEDDASETIVYIAADDADNSAAWSGNYDVSGRTRTTMEYAWVFDAGSAWTSPNVYNSGDIKQLVQEVVTRGGWSSGNSMSFILWDDGADQDERVADSYEGGNPVILHVDYVTGVTPPQAYCPSYYVGTGSEYITNVAFNTINNPSGDAPNGYTDFTNIETDVDQGNAYQLDVTINTAGNFTDHCQAFFDWNHDGDFADPNEMVDLGDITNATNGVLSATVNVPAGATLGSTRMRITIEYDNNPGACNSDHTSANWGETEDYTINIQSAAPPTPPVANFSAGATSICEGESISFSDLSTNTPTSWAWSVTGPTTLTSTVQNPAFAFTTPGTYSVELTATNADGSDTYTASNLITVNGLPTVTANATTTAVCDGESVTLTGGGASTYSWNNGVNDGVSFVPTATQTYTVTGTDGNNCENTAQVSVTVNPLPTVSANATTTELCEGQNVTLTGGGASTYSWNNGVNDGVAFAPTTSQTYTVTGTDANNCENTAQVTVNVNALPNVTANASNTTVCEGEAVTLTGGGASTYTWNNGVSNGTPFNATTTATYTVTGTDGSNCSNTAQITINVNPLPTVTAAATTTEICDGESVILTGGGANTYAWTNGVTDGVSFNPSTTNTYTVTGTDGNNCENTAQVTVTVNALPTVVANTTSSSVCDGDAVTLTGSGASTYTWDNGVTNGVSFVPGSTDTYTVTGTDANNCVNTAQVSVTVNNNPTPAIAGSIQYCAGSTAFLDAGSFNTYNWSTGDASQNITATIADNPVSVTVTDANGCQGTDQVTLIESTSIIANSSLDICQGQSVSIHGNTETTSGTYSQTYTTPQGCDSTSNVTLTVNTLPTVDGGADFDVCEGTSVTLNGSGADTYAWDNSVNDGVSFIPTSTATYTVTGTDVNGCENTADITVTVNPLPTVTLNPAGDSLCLNNGMVALNGMPTGGTYTGTGVSGTDFDPATAGLGMHTVSYDYTDINGCANSDQVSITVINCLNISSNELEGINVYPNPTDFELNIELPSQLNVEVRIFDASGKLVASRTVNGDTRTIFNVSDWERGNYIVRITDSDSGKEKVQQVIVQ